MEPSDQQPPDQRADGGAVGEPDPAQEALLDATTALVPAVLNGLDVLAQVGRHLHPPAVRALVEQSQSYAEPVREGLAQFRGQSWPDHLEGFTGRVEAAADNTVRAFDGLARCLDAEQPLMGAYRALRFNGRAQEALYPLAATFAPVSRFFLNPQQRRDPDLAARLAAPAADDVDTGVLHAANAREDRGGFSLYVPEYYDAAREWPLVIALHGGSGHGRDFLWSWLADARGQGALVLAATSVGSTWSLMEPQQDLESLQRMLEFVRKHYRVDDERVLLTGMSDGGTFSWVCGVMAPDGLFTHIAPVSASFHPMLLEAAEPGRLAGLPIYLVHGALDWMFAVDTARTAEGVVRAAGANVVYREIEDLSHTYPREENAAMLRWLAGAPAPDSAGDAG